MKLEFNEIRKSKMWNKEKHWFSKKVCIVFGGIAIALFGLMVVSLFIWQAYIWPSLILSLLALIFGCLSLAPLIGRLY